ncbi:MAG: pyridoxamine 5'-phosphate oxidase family protein [Desulfobacteraceae bacterium]|nr:MAG: pyridoxamine 5'-phosphate oxidase family protein [Desulfobacteraceae bacterium]
MRRKDREIKSREEIDAIIKKALVCRLGMADESGPYVVPLSFGYRDGFLFFHSAKEGKKLDILRKNNKVCFEMDTDHEVVKSEKACDWGMKYKSVIGFGHAFVVEDIESMKAALDVIMAHYSAGSFEYDVKKLERTVAIKVEIEYMTGKKKG